jgi:hypothetical protein
MYVYAFLQNPPSDLTFLPGIQGELQIIQTEKLAAVGEPNFISLEAIEKDEQRLMQAVLIHDRILCDLFDKITILPLRFGTIFRSPADVLTHLNQRQSEYLQKLQQLEGKAEYLLKVEPLDPPMPSTDPEARGKSYLLAKKKRYQIAQDFQAQQSQEWENLKQAIACRGLVSKPSHIIMGETQANIHRIYLLIPQEDISLLWETLEIWQETYPTWQLNIGEPVPPYHFV